MELPLLVTNPSNIRYLTGFVGALPDEREAFVLLTEKIIYLFTNVLYIEEARGLRVTDSELRVIEISRENPLSKELAKVLIRSNLAMLEFEENNLTVAELKKLKKELKGIKLKPTQGRIEQQRMIKRDDEIENIRKACALTDQCFSYILPFLGVGVTEKEIAWEMESFIRKNGGQLAFTPIVAFGVNSSKPHYSGTGGTGQETGAQENDVVLLDFGAKVNGYCADMTRVVFVGTPKPEWVKAYETVAKAQGAALNFLEKNFHVSIHESFMNETKNSSRGVSGASADKTAKEIIEKSGFVPYPHSLGHGVGLDIHEAPRLSVKKDATVKPGMTVTVEPGIYVEGAYGIRIEDLVRLTDTGIEILTKSSKAITIL